MIRKKFFSILEFLLFIVLFYLECFSKAVPLTKIINPEEKIMSYYDYCSLTIYWNEIKYPLIIFIISLICFLIWIISLFFKNKLSNVLKNLFNTIYSGLLLVCIFLLILYIKCYFVTAITYIIAIIFVLLSILKYITLTENSNKNYKNKGV